MKLRKKKVVTPKKGLNILKKTENTISKTKSDISKQGLKKKLNEFGDADSF